MPVLGTIRQGLIDVSWRPNAEGEGLLEVDEDRCLSALGIGDELDSLHELFLWLFTLRHRSGSAHTGTR